MSVAGTPTSLLGNELKTSTAWINPSSAFAKAREAPYKSCPGVSDDKSSGDSVKQGASIGRGKPTTFPTPLTPRRPMPLRCRHRVD